MKRSIFIIVIYLLSAFVICSCSEEKSTRNLSINEQLQYSDHSYQTGITIEDGPRQGFQYRDGFAQEYGYRYVTTTITNDSSVIANIKIAFGREYDSLRSHKILMSDVFLLPRNLTPKRQQYDKVISKELKDFLDSRMGSSPTLDITIKPKEHVVMTFGTLTKLGQNDPFTIQLKESNMRSYFALSLVLGNLITVPCGEITFPDK